MSDYENRLARNYERNRVYARPGPYQTFLGPAQETAFRSWVARNSVPFDPLEGVQDYDMRGFWNALEAGDPRARSAIDPNDQRIHYPDIWKTPYHETFSRDSRWATESAPQWVDDSQLAAPSGRILFDARRR